ncbi:hypothetical protein H5410_037986 [Solanum commersonii]|uniref:Uncharacterized protein n=1 Tax=Solanum commersonii TaxID=4109 RepID=A0A9J5Y9F8_SOLCO|nr:hypothetical protein H5410_037986 [Solanum commersonii]
MATVTNLTNIVLTNFFQKCEDDRTIKGNSENSYIIEGQNGNVIGLKSNLELRSTVVWYTRGGEEYASTSEAARNFLAFWYAGKDGEHRGSLVVRKSRRWGTRLMRGNELCAAAYGFWICGGWRRMRGVVAAANFSGDWAFSRAIESHDVLKGFNMLSLNEFRGSDDKGISRRVHNTNGSGYAPVPPSYSQVASSANVLSNEEASIE